MRALGGSFLFDSKNPGLLVSMLPEVVVVKRSQRLKQLVQMVGEETSSQRPGNEYMLSLLVELLLLEALRSTTMGSAPPGLLLGLGDDRLATTLTAMHNDFSHSWTANELAKIAALSRSTYFERFNRKIGVSPMGYLLNWRMEIAKRLLTENALAIAAVAEQVGYGSTSAFSVAFTRHIGMSPSKYINSNKS